MVCGTQLSGLKCNIAYKFSSKKTFFCLPPLSSFESTKVSVRPQNFWYQWVCIGILRVQKPNKSKCSSKLLPSALFSLSQICSSTRCELWSFRNGLSVCGWFRCQIVVLVKLGQWEPRIVSRTLLCHSEHRSAPWRQACKLQGLLVIPTPPTISSRSV